LIPAGNFPTELVIQSSSPEETEAAGEKIAACLKKGSVVALRGGLGAGKTCFVKGIARGFGVNEEVTSPTYTIISEYEAVKDGERLPFYHIDAYRLGGDGDFSALGGDEVLGGGGVSVVEWSEHIPDSIPAGALVVEIEIPAGDGQRKIRVRGKPE
jgi:tRNA threonylcarbamoyladenosine biosynthesis protein TsaE